MTSNEINDIIRRRLKSPCIVDWGQVRKAQVYALQYNCCQISQLQLIISLGMTLL